MKLFKRFSYTGKVDKSMGRKQQFMAQKISRRYCFSAVSLFALQSLVATLGSLASVIPDLPSPIPPEYGRAIHLALAVLWPLIGTMGMVYFFTTLNLIEKSIPPVWSAGSIGWLCFLAYLSLAPWPCGLVMVENILTEYPSFMLAYV